MLGHCDIQLCLHGERVFAEVAVQEVCGPVVGASQIQPNHVEMYIRT